jgi:hypothetical protein
MAWNLGFRIEQESLSTFVRFWAGKYAYGSENFYVDNIGKPLTETSRRQLFEWKNGGPISAAKWDSIVKNYPLVPPADPGKRYLDHNAEGGAIWNIFYLHCIDQDTWPIFDQHTYRAMKYMKNWVIVPDLNTTLQKYQAYKNEYIPFLKEINWHDKREIDKALFAFGKFLKAASDYWP